MKAFIYAVLYQPLFNILIFFAWLIPGHSIALAIIAVTVIIRIILLPSSIKAAKHQMHNMELQPKINKLKSEIKDPAEQQKAMMALYKEEGFSPWGSCLPILIQIPIIWTLFSVFKSGISGNMGALYSFIPRPDSVNTFFFGINMVHPSVWVLPIIAGVFQFILSYLSTPKNVKVEGQTADPTAMMSKQMLFIAPLITVFFGRSMPAALVIYWITTTVFGIFQQLYVNKMMRAAKKDTSAIKAPSVVEAKPAPTKKQDLMTKIMSKRLDKQEKKSNVTVTVRTKKR